MTALPEFSRVPIGNGAERVIRGLLRYGARALEIVRLDGLRSLSPVFVFRENAPLFVEALSAARAAGYGRSADIGTIECANGITIRLWANRLRGQPPAVLCIGRSLVGRKLGGTITLSGVELGGLARGLEWMRGVELATATKGGGTP